MTLYGMAKVASIVDVSRPTLYAWIEAGLVKHRHNLDGAPLFTPNELARVAKVAQERRRIRERVVLPGRPLGSRKQKRTRR